MDQNINKGHQERRLSVRDRINEMNDEIKNRPDLTNESSMVKIEYYLIYISLLILAVGIILFAILYFQNIANVSRSGSPESGDVAGWGVLLFPIAIVIVAIGMIPDYLNRMFFNKYIYNKNNKWLIYIIISSILGCIIINTKYARELLGDYYLLGLIIYLVFKISTIIYSSLLLKNSPKNSIVSS